MTPLPAVWTRFRGFLERDTPTSLVHLRLPATAAQLTAAGQALSIVFPKSLCALYLLCDGFVADQYLLREDLRLLPLEELVAQTLKTQGEPVVTDALAGEVSRPRRVARLVFAVTRTADPDIKQISLKLPAEKVEVWYREGGLHDFEEVVNTGSTLSSWLDDCLEYYA